MNFHPPAVAQPVTTTFNAKATAFDGEHSVPLSYKSSNARNTSTEPVENPKLLEFLTLTYYSVALIALVSLGLSLQNESTF